MSNFNDVLAEAEDRRKKATNLLDDLDRVPAAKTSTQPAAGTSASSTAAASSSPPVKSVAPIRDQAVPIAPPANYASAGAGLPRADSSGNALEDAGLIEETGIAMSMCGFSNGSEPVGQQLFAMAGLHPPSECSFEKFYRDWFEKEHFPIMSEDVKRELVYRAQSKGFFSGLSSQVKKWAMANTDARLQSDVWYSYFLQNAPPSYKVYGCMRIAWVNLGSVAHPCWVKFYGMPAGPESKDQADQWVMMPWEGHSPDISALLDELDGRGGMTALLASAT